MKKILTLLIAGLGGVLVPGQAGAQAPYCGPNFGYGCGVGDQILNAWTQNGITNFSNMNSGCSSGNYSYNSSMVVSQMLGGTFDLNMQAGPSYQQGFMAWIDWNQDGDFSDAGETIYTSPTYGLQVFTTTVTVPFTAIPGTTRMRIRCDYYSIPTDPCNNQYYGEIEDYNVDILAPYANDAGISAIDSPAVPACVIGNTVYVSVSNMGTSPLTSATVNWSVNNIPMTPVTFTGNVPSYTDTLFYVGAYGFTAGDVLKIWTSNPNGVTDSLNSNDTMVKTLHPSMAGIYTIGGVSADYPTFGTAAADLMAYGVCDTVTFLVSSGTYNEQFVLSEIMGASATSPIYFKSVTGDSTSVTVTHTGTGSADNYVVKFTGADYVSFSGMSLINPGTYYGRVVTFESGSNHNTLTNLVLRSDTASWGWSDQQVVYSGNGNDEFLTIANSRIRGGSQGIYLSSGGQSTLEDGLVIQGNRLDKAYDSPIYLQYQKNANIDDNTIRHNSTNSWGNYVYLWQVNGVDFTRNDILGSATGYALYMDNSGGTNNNRGLIANNFINIGDTNSWSDAYGIYSYQMSYTDIVNNSFYLKSNSNWGTAIRIEGALNTFSNNSVYFKVPGGTGIAVNANYALTQADNNNYYWPNADFGSINWSTVTDLPTWQSTLGVDMNSMEVDPQYLSLTDLHTCSPDLYQAGMPVTGLTMDIDGESRNGTPSIGADEFISPTVFTLGPDVTKCEGATAQIGPGIAGTTYAWNTGDTTSTIGVLFPSTYTVVVTNSCGSGTDNIDVFDTPLPVAGFTNTFSYLTGVFTNTSTGGATSYFWDFGDGNTSTDSDPMHIFQRSGSHDIMFIATNDCGSDTLYQQIIIAIPSVGENETGLSLQAYPNPSQGVFYVVLNDVDGNGNINITDVQGKQVYSNTFTASGNWNETLNLSHLSKGVYLMNITTDSGRVVERLVID